MRLLGSGDDDRDAPMMSTNNKKECQPRPSMAGSLMRDSWMGLDAMRTRKNWIPFADNDDNFQSDEYDNDEDGQQ